MTKQRSETRHMLIAPTVSANIMKTKYFILNVLTPLILGGFIYVMYGSKNLLMNKFLGFISTYFNHFKHNIIILKPIWILNNLPDGLWVYSVTSYLLMIWNFKINFQNILWISSGFLIMFIAEIMQKFKLLIGTFDYYDLLAIIIGFSLPIIFNYLNSLKISFYENK